MKEEAIRNIVSQVMETLQPSDTEMSFPVETSARHVHLTEEAVEELFGEGVSLTEKRPLSLPGFLSEQRVSIVTKKGSFHNVAVLGPERSAVQVEISRSDARALGIDPPVRLSGDLDGAGDVVIIGDKGSIRAEGSVIIAKAHVHMNGEEAKEYGVKDGDSVDVLIKSERPVTISDARIRVAEGMHACMHIDVDESNAAACIDGTRGVIVAAEKGDVSL